MSLTRLISKRDSSKSSKRTSIGLRSKKDARFSGDFYDESGDKMKKPSKDERDKIIEVESKLKDYDLKATDERILSTLRGKYACGDPDKALQFLELWEGATIGLIRGIDLNVKLAGSENNNRVTCYLDSLLFALYARLESFEAMLFNSFEDEARNKLAAILRLFVNMLRSGKLITTDIIQRLQNSLAECGWKDAAKREQQDTSEAFTFIAEKLDMPLLTLKVDIAHGGLDIPDDDHKFVNERLLNIGIPPELECKGSVTLEECLEAYFNNRVDVQRKLERRSTLESTMSAEDKGLPASAHIEYTDLGSSPSTPVSPSPMSTIRSASLLRTIESHKQREGSLRTVSSRKEITIPAWQFFNLLPFYTDCQVENATTKAAFANHFSSKRPIIGLCLKRYGWTKEGKPVRKGITVKIPTEIELPHFVADEDMEDPGHFRLLLQSAVCHRGETVHSGHYIALVRSDGDKWLRFDDLAATRVTEVDQDKAFSEESPYLLFYQVVMIDEDESTSISLSEDVKSRDTSTYENDNDRSSSDTKRTTSSPRGSNDAFTSNEALPKLEVRSDLVSDSNTPSGNHSPVEMKVSPTSTFVLAAEKLLQAKGSPNPEASLRPTSRQQSFSQSAPASTSNSRSTSKSADARRSFVALTRLTTRKSKEESRENLGDLSPKEKKHYRSRSKHKLKANGVNGKDKDDNQCVLM